MTSHSKYFHKGFKLLVTQDYVTLIKISLLSTLLSSQGATINNILETFFLPFIEVFVSAFLKNSKTPLKEAEYH